jgi:phage antirepressor YoqD-like protein
MTNIIPLPIIAGVEIATDDHGRFNLNLLHKASGAEKSNGPSYWLALDSTKKLIDELKQENTEIPVFSAKGRNGGTFAHELLAISYAGWISPSFQLKVNQVFLDYRTGILQPIAVPQTLPEALRLALELAEANAEMKPKVAAYQRLAESEGSLCITDAAKCLQTQPKVLTGWLEAHRWIYRRLGKKDPIAYQDKIQRGLLEHKITTVERADGSEKIVEQVRVTPKGLAELGKRLGEPVAA